MSIKSQNTLNTTTHAIFEWRTLIGFAIIFFGLQWLYVQTQGTIIQTVIIDQATVSTSAAIINIMDPEALVSAEGHKLKSSKANLSVMHGCEGIETFFLLIAAICIMAAKWKNKVFGILFGGLIIYLLNQLRIILLFYVMLKNPNAFSAIHGFIAPAIIMGFTAGFFIFWCIHCRK